MIASNEKYLEQLEKVYGHHITPYVNPMDIMEVAVREDLDVELIADCDYREDFLDLLVLDHIVDYVEREEYL